MPKEATKEERAFLRFLVAYTEENASKSSPLLYPESMRHFELDADAMWEAIEKYYGVDKEGMVRLLGTL